MALDFPSSPTNGQQYSGAGGVVWTWDGVKWLAGAGAGAGNVINVGSPANGQWAQWTDATHIQGVATASMPFVQKAGDTMSGGLTVSTTGSPIVINETSTGASGGNLQYSRSGSVRWQVRGLHTAEPGGGANSGSDYAIFPFKDDGTWTTFTSLTISRLTGLITVQGDPTAATGVATKQYVDARGFSTGDAKLTLKTVADAGWVMMLDQTIGSSASAAANNGPEFQALFILLFNNINDTNAPILTSAGGATTRAAQGTAAAAWAANCRMTLTKQLGRSLAVGGNGAGLTARSLGQNLGAETHTLATAELAVHAHGISDPTHIHGLGDPTHGHGYQQTMMAGISQYAIDSGAYLAIGFATLGTTASATGVYMAGIGTGITISNAGSGSPHNNMQPTSFWNVMIKL